MLKCSATGKPGKFFSMLRRCSPKRCLSALFNVDERATATGGRLARKRLLDNKRALRATDVGVAAKVLASGTASV